MAVMNEVTEVLHKIEAKLYPNYLGKGGGADENKHQFHHGRCFWRKTIVGLVPRPLRLGRMSRGVSP